MPDTKYSIQLKLRLDWSEMDSFGHINNVSYFKYVQASRVNYWEAIGLAQWHLDNNIGPVLVSSQCSFMQPLHYPGNIFIEARVEFIKNTSFGIAHRILNEDGGTCAEAHDVMVMFDFNKNEKVPFPDLFRKKIEALEGRNFNEL